MPESILVAIDYLKVSLPAQLFAYSSLVLIFGVGTKIWSDSMRLNFLNSEPLSNIEFNHPYLPKARTMLITTICSVSLLFVSLDTIGNSALNKPYEWMYLAGFFAIVTAMGIISELRYQGSKDLAFSFVVGTALAFSFLVVRETLAESTLLHSLTLLVLLTAVTSLAWSRLYTKWTHSIQACLLATFMFWILLYIYG